jgi:hypothetical protein
MYEDGNTISFEQLQKYFDQKFADRHLNIEEHIMPRMSDIVIDTFLS